jgi:1,2-diacylglycerol 3-beta-glucosyltransferase
MIGLGVVLFTIVGIAVLACSAYLFALAVIAALPASSGHEAAGWLRFDIVVPAHDEEAGIGVTIASLRALDYPVDRYRILVVADNCTDATARVAAEAGARVIERRDALRRGKGYALALAFAQVEKDNLADAVVVIDADSLVSPGLLRAFARRFEAGESALQAAYGARSPEASWRSRLMVIALSLFHGVRSLGRERLGLSAGLRGNGMGFSREVLRRVPAQAFSVVEDVEYGIKLAEAGYRVGYVHEAQVMGDMAPPGPAAASQRLRWERGRAALARAEGPKLLLEGLLRRDPMRIDLAMDLLVPPLSGLALAALLGAMGSTLWCAVHGGSSAVAVPWLLSCGFLVVYVLRGLALSGVGLVGSLALLWAPVYIVWKIGLRLRPGKSSAGEWVRTARGGRP